MKNKSKNNKYPKSVKDLDSAVEYLKKRLTKRDIEYIKKEKPTKENIYFPDLFCGMNIRNNLGLWHKTSPLYKWFLKNLKLGHADDTSTILIDCLFRDIKDEPRQVERLAEYFINYWAAKGCNAINGEKLP